MQLESHCLRALTPVSPSDDGECENCHPSCASCSGDEENQCATCATGLSLSRMRCPNALSAFLFSESRCGRVLSLPPPGRFLTAQRTCVSKCPGGAYGGRLSGVCDACPPGCLQCVDAQLCTRCHSTRRAPLFLQAGQCVQQCVRYITYFLHTFT